VALSLDDCLPLALDLISDGDGRNLFRQYIQRYHYLGYKVPCGAQLRYFVRSHALSNRIVACLLFTSAALKIAPRDHWIGWSDPVRKRNLPRIVTNSRFLITVDGSYTNQVLLKALPPQTTLIGRIRQDADLRLPLNPNAQTNGRPRKYGFKAPTPKEILSDDSVPFHQVPCFAVGEMRDFKVKTFGPVFWTKAGSDKPLLLVVVKPLGYSLRKGSKLLYREPAFLICTDPTLDLKTLVQAYSYRWEIEVNHHDKKASSASLKHKPEIRPGADTRLCRCQHRHWPPKQRRRLRRKLHAGPAGGAQLRLCRGWQSGDPREADHRTLLRQTGEPLLLLRYEKTVD
jgi:hypothetical protein